MSGKNIEELYDGVEMPANLKDQIISAMDNAPSKSPKGKRAPKKRTVLIAVAVMLSLTMLVSAATVIYNVYTDMYMLPSMGLFDGFNESVRSMPKVLEFGETTIEMAMTYDRDGVSVFNMTIYGEGDRYTDHAPNKADYQKLEMELPDGTVIYLDGNESGGSHGSDGKYSFSYFYEYENFPDQSEFVLKSNAIDISMEVTLTPIAAVNARITDNGIKRIKMIPAAEGSRIYSYNIEVLQPSLAEANAVGTFYMIQSEHSYLYYIESGQPCPSQIFFKNGTTMPCASVSSMINGAPIFAVNEGDDYKYHIFGEMYFDYSGYVGNAIDKIVIQRLKAHLSLPENSLPVSLAVPEKGERIDYETPLKIAEIGEFTLSIDAIERNGAYLKIYTSERDIIYSGAEDISNISFGFENSSRQGGAYDSGAGGYTQVHTIIIPKDYSEDTFETTIVSLDYIINGYWEIDFE